MPRTFTYAVPPELRAAARPGARVLVPFANREKIGWIDRIAETPEKADRIKPIAAVLDAHPSVTSTILQLSRWIADYYLAPLGLVLRTALPAGLTDSSTDYVSLVREPEGEDLSPLEVKLMAWLADTEGPQAVLRLRRELGDHGWWPVIRRMEERGYVRVETEGPRIEHAVKTRRVLRIAQELPTLLAREEAFGRAKRQREAYETLESLGGRAEAAHLTAGLGFDPGLIRKMVKAGLLATEDEVVSRDPYAEMAVAEAPRLQPTEAQAGVIRELVKASRTRQPGTFLLRGVTGSGKTLVYIELLREVAQGTHTDDPRVRYLRATSVTFDFERPIKLNTDGEVLEASHCEYAVLPKAARFFAGEDTFAEAFPMRATRVIITADKAAWARTAAGTSAPEGSVFVAQDEALLDQLGQDPARSDLTLFGVGPVQDLVEQEHERSLPARGARRLHHARDPLELRHEQRHPALERVLDADGRPQFGQRQPRA